MGPCIGPLVGGWIGERAGWRWICKLLLHAPVIEWATDLDPLDWVLFIFSGVCFGLSLWIPESLAPVLLRRKAEKLRKTTGDDRYRTLEELKHIPFSESLKIALIRPLSMLFTEPIVTFMTICMSLVL